MLHLLSQTEPIPFEEFYRNNYSKTVQYINKKIGSLQDAEDLASEIFLYCFHHYQDYNPQKSSQSTWLYLITNSRIKNFYRDTRIFVDLESLVGILPDDSPDMDACIYLDQLKIIVHNALNQLPEYQQKIVTMRYFENRSSSEIGAHLGISPVNVRVQLSRALNTLEKLCNDLL